MADIKRKKVNLTNNGTPGENNSGILDSRVSRRKAVGTGVTVGAAVAGLAVGLAGGYFAGGAGSGGSGATSTVTNTVTNTVTATGAGGGPFTGNIVLQTLAGGGDQFAVSTAKQYNSSHPGANVSTQPIPEANMNASSITAVTSGPPPDIIYNSTIPAFNAQIVTPGYALQLDQYVTEYAWDTGTLPTFSAYGNVGGHWYWFTIGSIYYGNVYYNIDLFNKMSIAPPTDNASLYAAAAALTKGNLIGMAHGYQTQPEWFMNTFSDMLMNHISSADYATLWNSYGPQLKTAAFKTRTIKWTDAKVMDIWNELAKLGTNVMAPGTVTTADSAAVSLFTSQKAGMYAVGSWGASTLEQPVGGAFKYGFTPWGNFTPGFANASDKVRIVTFPTPYFVHYKTKNPALAADFLNWMINSDPQQNYFKVTGVFPIIPLGSAITPDPYLQSSLNWSGVLDGRPSLAATVATELHDPIENAIGAVLSGSQKPADAAQSVETLAIQLNTSG